MCINALTIVWVLLFTEVITANIVLELPVLVLEQCIQIHIIINIAVQVYFAVAQLHGEHQFPPAKLHNALLEIAVIQHVGLISSNQKAQYV